jgi:hypothetical protein
VRPASADRPVTFFASAAVLEVPKGGGRLYWNVVVLWRYRLTVRTEPSQGLNRGSIPLSATISDLSSTERPKLSQGASNQLYITLEPFGGDSALRARKKMLFDRVLFSWY